MQIPDIIIHSSVYPPLSNWIIPSNNSALVITMCFHCFRTCCKLEHHSMLLFFEDFSWKLMSYHNRTEWYSTHRSFNMMQDSWNKSFKISFVQFTSGDGVVSSVEKPNGFCNLPYHSEFFLCQRIWIFCLLRQIPRQVSLCFSESRGL
jgi:hypothetical protein